MKKIPLLLCGILTMLALGVGFFLPRAVCAALDKSALVLRESYDTDNVTLSFAPTLSIGEKMARCNRGYSYVTGLETGKKMDKEAAIKRANDILASLFADYELSFGVLDAAVIEAFPQLYVYESTDGASVVNWICSCAQDEKGFYLDMIIDDETGALMAMNMSWSYTWAEVPYAIGVETAEKPTNEAVYILADYISRETGFLSYSVDAGDRYGSLNEYSYGQYIITFYDDSGESFQTSFQCGDSYFIFNF